MPDKGLPATLPSRRVLVVALLAIVGLAALSLWCLTLTEPGSGQRDIAAALRIPKYLFQVRALANGIHFQAVGPGHQPGFGVQLGRAMNLGFDWPNGGYVGDHDGYFVSGLGFIAAWLPHTFNGGDYIMSPFVAVVLPYWFLIAGSAIGLAATLGVLRALAERLRRASAAAWYAAGVVLFLFFLANLVPSTTWAPGRNLDGSDPLGWVAITFWPWAAHNEVALRSGFPLECYRRAFINGQRVKVFYGDDTQGLYQHRMMENACIALVTAGAAMLTIEALRRRTLPLKFV